MIIRCDECNSATFNINVRLFDDDAVGIFGDAICTECGNTTAMGTDT